MEKEKKKRSVYPYLLAVVPEAFGMAFDSSSDFFLSTRKSPTLVISWGYHWNRSPRGTWTSRDHLYRSLALSRDHNLSSSLTNLVPSLRSTFGRRLVTSCRIMSLVVAVKRISPSLKKWTSTFSSPFFSNVTRTDCVMSRTEVYLWNYNFLN